MSQQTRDPEDSLDSWCVVAAMFLTGFMLYGGGLYSFILLSDPVAQEFHWNRAQIGALVSAFWLSAPLSLFADPLLRRFGGRRLTLFGVALEGICLVNLIWATQVWQMYVLRVLAGLGKVLFAVSYLTTLAQWFRRRFGLAVAVSSSGWHLGGLVLAPITAKLIGSIGWRGASVVIGTAVVLLAAPAAYWAFSQVAPYAGTCPRGHQPDGPEPGAVDAHSVDLARGHLATLAYVFSLPAFRLIAISSVAYYTAWGGVLAHQPAVVETAGISKTVAALALGSTAGFAAVGAILMGFLVDRWSLAQVTVVQIGLLGAGVASLLSLLRIPSDVLLVLHVICFGLSVGGADPYWISITRRQVRGGLFAYSFGIWYFIALMTIVISPVVIGALHDATKSFGFPLSMELGILIVPMAGMLLLAARGGAEDSTGR